jgi:hypothetical protein
MKTITDYMTQKMSVNESIRGKDFETARAIMIEYFKKYGIYSMPSIEGVTVKGTKYFGNLLFNVKTNLAAYVLWGEDSNGADSMGIRNILFFDDAVGVVHSSNDNNKLSTIDCAVRVNVNNVSIARLLPLIKGVLSGEDAMDKSSIQKAVAKYDVLAESAEGEARAEMVNEDGEDILAQIAKEKDRAYYKWYDLRKAGASAEEIDAAKMEFDEVKDRYNNVKIQIQGGAKVSIESSESQELAPISKEFEQRLDPKVRFQHMYNYINMVLKGISHGLIISGAPGIGKTHNVKKLIKQTGYQLGDNYQLISGRCTPAALYLGLYNYSREDDITLIDDCDDALIDTNAVNILKAALDSGDERILSYFVSTTPEVTEEDAVMRHPELVPDKKGKYHAPRQFEYNGRIIIITNMYAGSLDTALRNRCIVCNLDFTTEETLGIVKDIMPAIMPDKLDAQAKQLALNFLEDMADKKADMEISIRSFTTVAKIFAVCGDTEDARWMCAEQMKLQYARPGKRKRY